ncbi:glucosaminidase domain-containing protein [Teredinibacter haidensis]|uniref:glucosaminidase domain-containing protein n=1 Tax=Teredinibacter haidensis TaxID=2731755 RepID=UPI000AD18A50|nr:glucosaminidase domain-containing protein [Teredinibacter haidensis]
MIFKKLLAIALVAYLLFALIIIIVASHHRALHITPAPSVAQAPDFAEIENIKERKAAFFAFLRPLIETENQKILAQREKLTKLTTQFSANGKLNHRQQTQLLKLAEQFSVKPSEDTQKLLGQLSKRVDTLPAALVLAQAANESSWGRSRFATEGNNYFGQWCFKKGCGLVPSKRAAKAGHEVRKFDSAGESVAAYFFNLNTHRAYKSLRELRTNLRVQNIAVTGHALAGGLTHYSERGKEYIEELRVMIRVNRLE